MKKRIYDVTLTISNGMVVYPGDPEVEITPITKLAGRASANVSCVSFNAHVGTHLDAPYHYFEKGRSLDEFPPDVLIGPCLVCDMGETEVITKFSIQELSIADYKRVLFKTKNSRIWKSGQKKFIEDFVYISTDAAEHLASLDLKVVGIDYFSVDSYRDRNSPVHKILLGKGVLLIESLDLSDVPAGSYELICAPLKIENSDGAPARVFLREL